MESAEGGKYYLVEVIAFIIQYFKDQLIAKFSNTKYPIQTTDFHWIITIPAIWSARSKSMMRKAAYLVSHNYTVVDKLSHSQQATPIWLHPHPVTLVHFIGDKFSASQSDSWHTCSITESKLDQDKCYNEVCQGFKLNKSHQIGQAGNEMCNGKFEE